MRTTSSFLALAASVSAATISIDVGENGSLKFNPDTVTAAMGDSLEFHFYAGGHSVVSSTFSSPCVPATDAFFSGYIPGTSSGDTTFVVDVNSTDPIWFYCSLADHCELGMVGVVNPPPGKTVSDYAKAAEAVGAASAPPALQGGVLTSIASSPSAMSTTGNERSTMSSPSTTTTSSLTGEATDTGVRSTAILTSVASSSLTGMATDTGTRVPSTTSASASAATTSASAGVGKKERSDVGAVLGLAVFAGGLVALMA